MNFRSFFTIKLPFANSDKGDFQLLHLIIPRLKIHMIPYKFKSSHWLKLQHSDWRANLVKDFFLQINFPPMRALEFMIMWLLSCSVIKSSNWKPPWLEMIPNASPILEDVFGRLLPLHGVSFERNQFGCLYIGCRNFDLTSFFHFRSIAPRS